MSVLGVMRRDTAGQQVHERAGLADLQAVRLVAAGWSQHAVPPLWQAAVGRHADTVAVDAGPARSPAGRPGTGPDCGGAGAPGTGSFRRGCRDYGGQLSTRPTGIQIIVDGCLLMESASKYGMALYIGCCAADVESAVAGADGAESSRKRAPVAVSSRAQRRAVGPHAGYGLGTVDKAFVLPSRLASAVRTAGIILIARGQVG